MSAAGTEFAVTSIYQRVLGSDFCRLHPQIQRRFGFCSSDGVASVGTGVMERIWRRPFYTLPFFRTNFWPAATAAGVLLGAAAGALLTVLTRRRPRS